MHALVTDDRAHVTKRHQLESDGAPQECALNRTSVKPTWELALTAAKLSERTLPYQNYYSVVIYSHRSNSELFTLVPHYSAIGDTISCDAP